MKKYLIMSRSPFLTAIVIPIIFSTALVSSINKDINWIYFILTLIGLVFSHLGSNLLNDYYDYKLGVDQLNENRTPFSGGSPSIVDGTIDAKKFLYYSILSFIIAIISGIYLIISIDKGVGPILYFMLVGGILGVFYTAPPLKLAYRGFGELTIMLTFGILPVVANFYIQTETLSIIPLIGSLPLTFLITNIIWVNQFPDYDSDLKGGKKNLLVRLGKKRSVYIYDLLMFGSYLLIIPLYLKGIFNVYILLTILIFPIGLISVKKVHLYFNTPEKLVDAQKLTILTHLGFGITSTISLLIH